MNDESECDRPVNTPNSRRKHAGGRVKVRRREPGCHLPTRLSACATGPYRPATRHAPHLLTRLPRAQGAQLTKEQVLAFQHLSLKDAAKACRMGTTQVRRASKLPRSAPRLPAPSQARR